MVGRGTKKSKTKWKYKILPPPTDLSEWGEVWDDLIFPLGFRPHLQRSLIDPISRDENPTDYSIILFGPPGTGKTTLLMSTAKQLKWELIIIGPQTFVGKGPSVEATINKCFEDIKKYVESKSNPAKIIFAFDEIDELVSMRDSGTDRQTRFATTMMLPLIQGLRDLAKKHTFVFFVLTNHIERFDPAITRRGRFDLILPLGPPDRPARFSLLEKFLDEIHDDYAKYNIEIRRSFDRTQDTQVSRVITADLDLISRSSAKLTLRDLKVICQRVVEQQLAMENITKEEKRKTPSYLLVKTSYFIDWIYTFRNEPEHKKQIDKFYQDKSLYARGSTVYPKSSTIQELVEFEFSSLRVRHNLAKLDGKWKAKTSQTIEFSLRNLTGLSYFSGQITAIALMNSKQIGTAYGDLDEHLSPGQASNTYELKLKPPKKGEMEIKFLISGNIDIRGIEQILYGRNAVLSGTAIKRRKITIV